MFFRENWDLSQKRVARVSQKVPAELGREKTRLPDFLDQGSSWGPNWVNPILQTKDRPTVKVFFLITVKRIGLGPGSHLFLLLPHLCIECLGTETHTGISLLVTVFGYPWALKNLAWFLKAFSEGWSLKLSGTSEQWFAFKHLALGNPTQG